VGVTSPDEIVKNIRGNLQGERIIVFGVGYDVNTLLLDRVSKETKGFSEYIEPPEDLELAISSVYKKIMHPAVEDPEIEFIGVDVYKLHPSKIGDLFYGQDVIIAGRYREGGTAQVLIKGLKRGKRFTIEKSLDFASVDEDLYFIPITWAKKRVAYLLSEIRLHGENRELVDEIVMLGKRYGIVTPYTSYLVEEKERHNIPFAGIAPRALREEATGKRGFAIAKALTKMERETIATLPEIASIKHVGVKTFYLKGSRYVDAEYKKGMETEEIKFGSKEYFDLLKKYPKYARYFALSKEITVVIKGVGYKVVKDL